MNVLIFYEHLVREWDASQRLKKAHEYAGDNVEIKSIIFEKFDAYSSAKKRIPDVIYVPWFVEEIHEAILSSFLDLNPQAIVINLHQEEIGSENSEYKMLPRTEFTKNGSFHFVWGEYFKDRLIACGVREENIEVTGNIRNDIHNQSSISKAELASIYGLDVKKKWILFAENRGWTLSRYRKRGRLLTMLHGESDKQYEQFVKIERENLKGFIAQMQTLPQEFKSKYEFVYRPHPGTVLNYDFPEGVHVIGDRPIQDWINSCDLFLTCESTSIFEAEMKGKPCAIVPSVNIPDKESKMAGVWEYPCIENISDINDALIEKIRRQNCTGDPIYLKYLGVIDGHVASRMVEASKKLFKQKKNKECVGYLHATPKQICRHWLYEKVTKITVATGLLDIIQFPRSAYVEKRDIPYSKENSWIWE